MFTRIGHIRLCASPEPLHTSTSGRVLPGNHAAVVAIPRSVLRTHESTQRQYTVSFPSGFYTPRRIRLPQKSGWSKAVAPSGSSYRFDTRLAVGLGLERTGVTQYGEEIGVSPGRALPLHRYWFAIDFFWFDPVASTEFLTLNPTRFPAQVTLLYHDIFAGEGFKQVEHQTKQIAG